MAIRESMLIGEPVLRETAAQVDNITSARTQEVIQDLIDTMRAHELVGIAAPQIGQSLQVFVSEIRETKYRTGVTDELRVYINPEISHFSRETELDWEGCDSIPGLFGKVERSTEVTLNYMNEKGVPHEMTVSGLLARVIQHEIDHLNGILFTDLSDPRSFVSAEYYREHIRAK